MIAEQALQDGKFQPQPAANTLAPHLGWHMLLNNLGLKGFPKTLP